MTFLRNHKYANYVAYYNAERVHAPLRAGRRG